MGALTTPPHQNKINPKYLPALPASARTKMGKDSTNVGGGGILVNSDVNAPPLPGNINPEWLQQESIDSLKDMSLRSGIRKARNDASY